MSQSQSDPAPFELYSYSLENFIDLVCKKTSATKEDLEYKAHTTYFGNYFSHPDIAAKSFIVENDYIDHDFLDDYVVYYAKCFYPYTKKCTRVHFFSSEIALDDFTAALSGQKDGFESFLQSNYLGFVVLKPLPRTFIGRTCLKTYKSDNGRRYYLTINSNTANLYGFELTVDSLPFQEQDSIVAACATSALWSAFKATGKIFQHYIPSPSEITKAATLGTPGENRFFPNIDGLTAAQMAAAIRYIGLEPLRINAKNPAIFKRTLYAYVKSGIPILLLFQLFDTSRSAGQRVLGYHAIAVTGYSMQDINKCKMPADDLSLRAYCVNKIYAHDDQIGPFSRLEIDDAFLDIEKEDYTFAEKAFSLTTTWLASDGTRDKIKALPTTLLVPIYNKVRIPFQSIFSSIRTLSGLLETIDKNILHLLEKSLTWDIYLTTVNQYKARILTEKRLPSEELYDALTSNYPKYIWIASTESNNEVLGEFLFDATDIDQSLYLVSIKVYNDSFNTLLQSLTELRAHITYQDKFQIKSILNYIDENK